MFDRLVAQAAALGLAALMTASVLTGIGTLSVREHAAADLIAARAAAHTVQASHVDRAPRI